MARSDGGLKEEDGDIGAAKPLKSLSSFWPYPASVWGGLHIPGADAERGSNTISSSGAAQDSAK